MTGILAGSHRRLAIVLARRQALYRSTAMRQDRTARGERTSSRSGSNFGFDAATRAAAYSSIARSEKLTC